jgi:hypothetical protein
VKIYAIRERWYYEVDDLIEFFLNRGDAERRVIELNWKKPGLYDDYTIEEVEAK